MIEIKTSLLLEALGYSSQDETSVKLISTDSRNTGDQSIFIALKGEKFDGHNYVEQALENGACYAVVQKNVDVQDKFRDRLIFVESTDKALMDVANCYRNRRSAKITAVTGSVGKTSTKEMIATILSHEFRTLKTQANLNNEIGVSKTLLELDDDHEAAVIEMGMDHFGEIDVMSRCVEPDIGVITNIGVSHIENLGSREGILKAKTEIRSGLKKGSPLLICTDNDMLCNFKDYNFKIYTYGLNNEKYANSSNAVTAKNIETKGLGTKFEILYMGKSYNAFVPIVGSHNVLNALCGFLVGILYGMKPESIVEAIAEYKTSGMRQKIVEHNGYTVVEDCYNASPDSMYAAIKAFGEVKINGKKILVISDMLELGENEASLHASVGEAALKTDVDLVLCTGERARHFADNSGNTSKIVHFETKQELFEKLKKVISPNCWVWFKASRGMKLEDIINRIYEEC